MEIERKFKLYRKPELTLLGKGVVVVQGYLPCETGEMRVRRKGNTFFLTLKGDGGLTRDEWESEIPSWVFSSFWSRVTSQLKKERFTLLFAGSVLEVDTMSLEGKELALLECEFKTEEEARKFQLPCWAKGATEVTHDPRYKNKNLAKYGIPSEE